MRGFLLCIQETTDRNRAANLHVELISCMEEYQFSQRKAARPWLSTRTAKLQCYCSLHDLENQQFFTEDPLALGHPRIAGADSCALSYMAQYNHLQRGGARLEPPAFRGQAIKTGGRAKAHASFFASSGKSTGSHPATPALVTE
ncbi:uncharacterized protein TrAtP1_009688 [Trichoderma atroviride]|uniref:uncharacterized protein n=1 Tax=Hypocrea atroviridis TaxID=63577 RepID=UPI00332A3BB7|nr:hypothetical protein TrAtP1_009688 [Trichoderma atroviride]